MAITLTGLSALRALRAARASGGLPHERCNLEAPSPPTGRRHWTRETLTKGLPGTWAPTPERPLDVVTPTQEARLRSRLVRCTTHPDLPPNSAVPLGEGVSLVCPELLFFELAGRVSPAVHALIGYELCGGYARDASHPRSGGVTFGLDPVTSSAALGRYLDELGARQHVRQAREARAAVRDDAWSPMEAVIALLATLPTRQGGYGIPGVRCNARVAVAGTRESRVPDILFGDTCVGINYDGRGHLDLGSIARANDASGIATAMRQVRRTYVDDRRRERELGAQGYLVLTATSEDLYEPGGLDRLMRHVLDGIASKGSGQGARWADARRALDDPAGAARRQELLRLLLPPRHAPGR